MNFAFDFIRYIFKAEFDNHISDPKALKLLSNANYIHDFSGTLLF
jgi:hypothetical protein